MTKKELDRRWNELDAAAEKYDPGHVLRVNEDLRRQIGSLIAEVVRVGAGRDDALSRLREEERENDRLRDELAGADQRRKEAEADAYRALKQRDQALAERDEARAERDEAIELAKAYGARP